MLGRSTAVLVPYARQLLCQLRDRDINSTSRGNAKTGAIPYHAQLGLLDNRAIKGLVVCYCML